MKKLSIQLSVYIFIIIFQLFKEYNTFGTKITLNSSTSSSITNYQTDLTSCTCNLLQSICDNFCCCDNDCTQTIIDTWNTAKYCKSHGMSNLQVFCSDVSGLGISSFQDLGCVYWTNRGSIGNFYNLPQAASLVIPTVNSFAQKSTAIKTRENIIVNPTPLTSQSYLQVNGIKNFFFSSFGGKCVKSPVKLSQGLFSVCQIVITSSNCKDATFYGGLQGINLSPSNSSGTSCTNVPKNVVVDVTLSSNGNTYTVKSISASPTYHQPILFNNKVVIQTTVNINLGSNSLSGNPGYLYGKNLMKDNSTIFTLQSFINSDNTCANNGTNPSGNLNLIFNQPITFTCTLNSATNSTNTSNLAIDNLFIKNYTILKYGSLPSGVAAANQIINIQGIQNSYLNFGNKSTIVLNILYSQSGWTVDPQNYILGAIVTSKQTIDFKSKSLIINWINVPPSSISSPPQNYFYKYFELLWSPLKSGVTSVTQTIGNSISGVLFDKNLNLFGYLAILIILIILIN